MNLVKKISSLALAAAMCISLGSCGSEKKYDYDLTKYLTPANISEITVSRKEVEEQLAKAKTSLQEEAAEKETLKEGDVLKNGDVTKIDFEGKMNGETFTGGSGTDYELELGSDKFIDGFEDGLVGKKVGEKVVLNLTFPSDYRDEKTDPEGAKQFNGKDVEFTVTVKSATRNALPEFTDSFVAEQTKNDAHPYSTTKEFEDGTRKTVIANLAAAAYVKACKVDQFPEKEYNEAFESFYSMYKTYATYSGVSVKEYVEKSGSSIDEMYQSINKSASTSVKQEMVYFYVARTNNITVSDEEYEEGAEHIAKENGLASAEELLDRGYDKDSIMQSVLFEKVANYIGEQVKINEDVTSDKTSDAASATSGDKKAD